MRALRVLVASALAVLPATAGAASPVTKAAGTDAHLLQRFVERERAGRWVDASIESRTVGLFPRVQPSEAFTERVPSALDCLHAKHDIRLDPVTGATSATLDLRIQANGKPLSTIGFGVDDGLAIDAVSADGRTATAQSEVATPSRIVRIDLSPALAAGESTTVHVAYSGTLACEAASNGGAAACTKGANFSYFAQKSIFPSIFDPASPTDETFDGLTREIVVHAPAGIDVVATGERVSDADAPDGTRTSSWSIDKPLSRSLGLYVLAGKLGLKDVPGRSVATTLVFPAPEQDVDDKLMAWSSPVLDFVEASAGARLPFQRNLSLVRLPSEIGDPGTATFGMTLLSETYARAGDLMHEETWAHENSHLFWGIVVPETDPLESRLMTEGMATLTELDYTFARHFAGEDRDLYLARRFVPIGLDLRSVGESLPAAQLAPGEPLAADFRTPLYTLWAYYKTAAALDHLRVTVGEDVFASALRDYMARCSFVGCRPDDLRTSLEAVSGKDLSSFFARWVTASTRPKVTFAFAPTGDRGAEIELTKSDDDPMTLELWLRLEDGSLLKHRVDLVGRTTRVRIDTPAKVRSVAPNPRHDVLVDSRSTVDGDLDFDGETDGFDLLECTRLVGAKHDATNAAGLWNVGDTFEPRCDVDGDFDIDDDDIERLTETFGKVRSEP